MRYEASGVARVLLGALVPHRASARTGGSLAEHSKASQRAQAPAVVSASDARCAAEGRRGETWTSRSPNYRWRVSRARGISRSSAAGKANWLRDPKETFPGCKALKNHETGKESRPPRGVAGRPSEHLRRAHPRGLPRACRSLCKALAGARRGKQSPIRRERSPICSRRRSRQSDVLFLLRFHIGDVTANVSRRFGIGGAERLLHRRHIMRRPGREV